MSTEQDIQQLFADWNAALCSGDPEAVTRLYAEDAILLPTVSNKMRHNREQIRDYFRHFLARRPMGRIDESHVRLFGELAIHSGHYTFTFGSSDRDPVQASFTFVYRHESEKRWRIVSHHSSALPEAE